MSTRGIPRRRGAQRAASLAGALLPVGVLAAALAASPATAATAAGGAGDARELVRRTLEAAPHVPFTATMTLTIEGGQVRELSLSHKPIGDARASYLEVTAPLNLKDTRFLFLERTDRPDEQYMYIPSMKRTTQVGEGARQQPFLGSEYYVSDLVSPELDAYTYAVAGEEEVLGRACRLVEATPKRPEDELYSKTVLAIDPADLLILRAQFFDPKGKLLKVWAVDRLERIDGVWTARAQRMTNVQEGTASTLEIRDIRYHAEVPDDVFNRAHLSR
jgi:outer membrane lipoprotein-sorting protein